MYDVGADTLYKDLELLLVWIMHSTCLCALCQRCWRGYLVSFSRRGRYVRTSSECDNAGPIAIDAPLLRQNIQ
jgi:hypothetical protein